MHTANQPYNVLDGADKQANGRKPGDLARLNRYAPVLRSYCAAGDPVCAGGNVVVNHLNYFELYTDDASSWVVSKIDNVAPLPSCAAPSSSSTLVLSSTVAISSATSASVPQSSAVAPTPSSMVTVSVTPTMVESSATETPCSTSPAMVSPFPSPVPYSPDSYVLEVHIEYAYV
jgi:hypothetical protein